MVLDVECGNVTLHESIDSQIRVSKRCKFLCLKLDESKINGQIIVTGPSGFLIHSISDFFGFYLKLEKQL